MLEARGLRWHHAGRWIVDGVTLIARPNEIVGLLGPNGAGKTVTLSMITGLIPPTSGAVLLDGTDVTRLSLFERARRGLGFLPQERSVFTNLSAVDNVAAVLEGRGMSRIDAHRRALTLLAQFGLSPLADVRAVRLSGGEQRRLEVARSVAVEPRYVLFDEPFAGIDPLTIESLHSLLVSLRESRVGVVITDHNVRETLDLCDRVYILANGRVLCEGPPAVVVDNPEVRHRFLGDTYRAGVPAHDGAAV